MKKTLMLMLMSALLLFGCGGGGGTTAGSSGGPGSTGDTGSAPGTASANDGFITLNFVEGPTSTLHKVGSSLPTPDKIRVVVRKETTQTLLDPETGDPFTVTTTTFKKVADFSIPPSGPAQMSVPADTGYSVDCISYMSDTHNNILKYGGSSAAFPGGVPVTAGSSTPVSIALNAVNATILESLR